MSTLKLYKEIKIKNFDDSISLKYGTVNRLRPEVIYIQGKSWLIPLTEGNYEDALTCIISDFKKKLKLKIFHSTLFSSRYIFDFELNFDKMKKGKNSSLSFSIYLKQTSHKFFTLKEVKPYVNDFVSFIDEYLTDKIRENAFALSKTKHR